MRRIATATAALFLLAASGLMAAGPATAAPMTWEFTCPSAPNLQTNPYSLNTSIGDTVYVYNNTSVTLNMSMLSGITGTSTTVTAGQTASFTTTASSGSMVAFTASGVCTVGMQVVFQAGGSSNPISPAAPADILQQVPIPATGSCSDVKDLDLKWGTELTGGWHPVWGDWLRTRVCSRTFHYGVYGWEIRA